MQVKPWWFNKSCMCFNHSKLDAQIVLLPKNLEIHKLSPRCNFGRFSFFNYFLKINLSIYLFIGLGGKYLK